MISHMTDATKRYTVTVIDSLEAFFAKYITWADTSYSLALALWTIGTYLYPDFDAFPYLVITSATKRSGKTRLAELLAFVANNPLSFGAITPAGLFHSIMQGKVTIFCDEAEVLSQEGATTLRAVLNMGYRKGQAVPRIVNGSVQQFPTYCPKVFILIGDVNDTLTDRSIVVRMKRARAPRRFLYETARAEGDAIRSLIKQALDEWGTGAAVLDSYREHTGLPFITDRDEELWTSLFAVAAEFCPHRIAELQKAAVDIATEKTAEARRYINLQGAERNAEDDEYATMLVKDVHACLGLNKHRHMSTKDLLEALYEMPTSPWRKFRGPGLSVRNLADMLSRFGVSPRLVRIGEDVKRGYRLSDVDKAIDNKK